MLISNVCGAFAGGVGTKVLDRRSFDAALIAALPSAQFSDKGTAYIPLSCLEAVSAGVGKRSADPDDYVLRIHRGRVDAYLRREKAAAVESLAAIVYTIEAYLSDPDVQGDADELKIAQESGCSHVIVAVLASAGPRAPVSPYRFCHNVAGGNIEYNDFDKSKLVEIATESLAYDSEWAVVSD